MSPAATQTCRNVALQANRVDAVAQKLAVLRSAWTDIAGKLEQLAEELSTVTAASPEEVELTGCVASVSANQIMSCTLPLMAM